MREIVIDTETTCPGLLDGHQIVAIPNAGQTFHRYLCRAAPIAGRG
jgi:hypothetical protein